MQENVTSVIESDELDSLVAAEECGYTVAVVRAGHIHRLVDYHVQFQTEHTAGASHGIRAKLCPQRTNSTRSNSTEC